MFYYGGSIKRIFGQERNNWRDISSINIVYIKRVIERGKKLCFFPDEEVA